MDVDTVVLKARKDKKSRKGGDEAVADSRGKARKSKAPAPKSDSSKPKKLSPYRTRELQKEAERLASELETVEERVREIHSTFATAGFFDSSSPEAVRTLEAERVELEERAADLMRQWEAVETELGGADVAQ